MTRHTKTILATTTLLAVLACGWFLLTPGPKPVQADIAALADPDAVGTLDGMVFSGVLGQVGEPGDVEDTLVFENGTFVSTECDKRCGYPARPYFVRQVGNKIEFISESNCLYKDAKIVWRGTIDGDTLKGVSSWTVKRWYWTIEKEFWFEGTLVERAGLANSAP